MEQFRERRAWRAGKMGGTPGIRWRVEVKDRLRHKWPGGEEGREKREGREDRMEAVWGDAGFADDTMIMGDNEEEMADATEIFKEMANKAGLGLADDKEETIRVGGGKKDEGEAKYLGVWIPDAKKDTAEKVKIARRRLVSIAGAWGGGGERGRGGGRVCEYT